MNDQVAYTPQQAATLLGVSTPTIRRRMDDGTLPFVKLGPRKLVPKWAIDQIAEGRKEADAESESGA